MIKKLFLVFLMFIIISSSSFGVEEIFLETIKEETTIDKIVNIYNGKIEENINVSPILKLFSASGYNFKQGPIDSVKFSFLYSGNLSYKIREYEHNSLIHDFPAIEPGLRIKFNNNKSVFNVTYNLLSNNHTEKRNRFTEKFSSLYIAHDLNENQRILFGQGKRLPVNYDGSLSRMEQEYTVRSQIGRYLGSYRSVGLRNIGKYKYIDYDIGVYDSTRYMEDFGRGYDFTGYVMLKPFADFENSIRSLRFGSGYNIGKYNYSYNIYSFFVGYDYKKFHLKSEYSNADNCNGIIFSRNKADGFYTSLSYDLTQKMRIHTRYDYFNPNKNTNNDHSQEFTIGLVYQAFKNLKLILDVIRKDNANKPDSTLILFATRFYI